MSVAIVFFSGFDVINFEINLIFLIKPFSCMIKKSRQELKHHEHEKSFSGEVTSIFHHFKGFSVAQNCLRPESAPLTEDKMKNTFLKIPDTKCGAEAIGPFSKKIKIEHISGSIVYSFIQLVFIVC